MKNIASKELNYIKDFLSWEILSVKKCNEYANQEANQQRQQLYKNAARVHQQNYMRLLNYCEGLNKNQTSGLGGMN